MKNNLVCLLVFFLYLTGCNSDPKTENFKFEPLSDSLYQPGGTYGETRALWVKYYEECMYQQVFPGTFYLGIQDRIYIGSINNQQEVAVNKGFHLLDTSGSKSVFNLVGIINSANCNASKLTLNQAIKSSFYNEVVRVLSTSETFSPIAALLDSTQLKVTTGSLYSNIVRLDTLVSMLNRTQDTSLVRFKELLLRPENVMLGQAVDLFGFTAELPIKGQLTPEQQKLLSNPQTFNLDNAVEKVTITLLSYNTLRVHVDKRYTVLGTFYKLKAE